MKFASPPKFSKLAIQIVARNLWRVVHEMKKTLSPLASIFLQSRLGLSSPPKIVTMMVIY